MFTTQHEHNDKANYNCHDGDQVLLPACLYFLTPAVHSTSRYLNNRLDQAW